MSRRIVFEKVSIKAIKRWVEPSGRKRQSTREFWQTISPFNRNAEGLTKSRHEIMREIEAERDTWMKEVVFDTGTARRPEDDEAFACEDQS